MNTKFTILVAASLLFAGVSQAQGTATSDFNKPRHEIRKEVRQVQHQKKHRHHKMKHHHHKMQHKKFGHQ